MVISTLYQHERRWLQIAVIVSAGVPVLAGAAGMIAGTSLLSNAAEVSLDSHVRYLSGVLFAMGLSFWAIVPQIEHNKISMRLLTFLVVMGGMARLAGALFVGIPSRPMVLALVMELVVTPLLCWWQARCATLERPR